MEIKEELLDTLITINDRFDSQITNIKRRNSNFAEFEYEFNNMIRNEGKESLKTKKATSTISACMDYIKQLNKDVLIYNDYINRLTTFQTDNDAMNNEINGLIRRSQDITDLITAKYNNLVRLTHEFLENPNEEIIEEINVFFNRNTSEEIQNELNSIENSVSNVLETLNSAISNDSFNVSIVPNNYNSTAVYDRSIPTTGYITRNELGKGTNQVITNGLKVPDVPLDDVMNFSYRIHNQGQSSGVSYDGKTSFTDDEFLYQEFLSYVTFKMREDEPNLSLKLEGLNLSEKREMLDRYKNEIINEITAHITINGDYVELNQYILESSAYLYILRTNGYDVNRNTDLNTFIRENNKGSLVRKEAIDQKQISNDFNTKYAKTHLDDANLSKILNDGRAITEERFNETNKVINKVGELEILLNDLMVEKDPKTQQAIISKILNIDPIGLMNGSYTIENMYSNGIYSSDQIDNFNMLAQNDKLITNLRAPLNQIRFKLLQRYSGTDVLNDALKEELCNKLLDLCSQILDNSQNIVNTYKKENNIVDIETTKETIKEEEKDIFLTADEVIEEKQNQSNEKEVFLNVEELKYPEPKKSKKAEGMYNDFSNQNKEIYDSIMKKSYTQSLNKLDNNELAYLRNTFKVEVEKIMGKSRENINESDVQYIAIYTKLNNRYKKVFGKEEHEIQSDKINDKKLDQDLEEILQNTDNATKKAKGR